MASGSSNGPPNILRLENSLGKLQPYFSNIGKWKALWNGSDMKKWEKTFDKNQALIVKYVGSALLAGRPVDSVFILTSGATGVGKSSTINALFNDRNLRKTSSSASETKDVSVVRKLLTVTKLSPALQGYLSIVDVPGTCDTDSKNEAANMACVRKFAQTRPELANRANALKKFSKYPEIERIRESVYPNIVLFLVQATDKRMDGPDSILAKSLKAFHASADFVDSERNNVIVVLTNAMALPKKPTKFNERLREKTEIIQRQVQTFLGINGVPVVPIENEPEDYEDEMEKDGDFYKLPNGECSHLNLFHAMYNLFVKNEDILGQLFTSWYFGDECPEKTQPAETSSLVVNDDDVEIQLADEILEKLKIVSGSAEKKADNSTSTSRPTSSTNRNEVASQKTDETIDRDCKCSCCFPAGSLVSTESGKVNIEMLNASSRLQTLKLGKKPGNHQGSSIGKLDKTRFCTYLDRKENISVEYLILRFDNGRKLSVSAGHIIFEYIENKNCIGRKQAKHFSLGERSIFIGEENSILTPQLVEISKEVLVGAYCPLTTSGTLIVDGFLVTSYAHTNHVQLAEASFLPLKLWCILNKRNGNIEPKETMNVAKVAGIHPYAKFMKSFRIPKKYMPF